MLHLTWTINSQPLKNNELVIACIHKAMARITLLSEQVCLNTALKTSIHFHLHRCC